MSQANEELYVYIVLNNLDGVKQAMKDGADVNVVINGETPLHLAARAEVDERIGLHLMAAGAEIDKKDENGRTPLHEAASSGKVELVKALIKRGADLNSVDELGGTPLINAVMPMNPDKHTAAELIKAGADLTIRTPDGETALEIVDKRLSEADKDIIRVAITLIGEEERDKARTPEQKAAIAKAMMEYGGGYNKYEIPSTTPIHKDSIPLGAKIKPFNDRSGGGGGRGV